jgi:hypothetical protein
MLEIREKLRENFKCGSAQPSLFVNFSHPLIEKDTSTTVTKSAHEKVNLGTH